jgi:hypothetical protein
MKVDVDLSRLNETEAGMFTYLAIKAMGHDPNRLFRTFIDVLLYINVSKFELFVRFHAESALKR